MDNQPTTTQSTDQPVDVQGTVQNPEEQKQLRVPDDIAGWAIACLYDFDHVFMKDAIERAGKAFGYYNGDRQWDPDIAKKLKAEQPPRPCLTFNEVRPKIDALIGEERRNREDWIARPQEESDDAEAEIRTALLKHVREINDLEEDESRAWEEEVVGGWGGAVASLHDVTEGEPPLLRIQYRPWKELKWDWTSRCRDKSDAQWMALSFLASVEKLRETLPQYKDDIGEEYLGLLGDPRLPDQAELGERPGVTRYLDGTMRPMLYSAEERRVRVTEFHYRTTRKRPFLSLVTPQGVTEREINDTEASLAAAKQIHAEGRGVLRFKDTPAIRTVLIVGRRTLASWWCRFRGTNAFGIPYFPIFVAVASDTDGYIMGLVEPMMGPQDEVNKRWSMMVENYAKQARSGGMAEQYAVDDLKKFEREYGAPGKWSEVKAGALVSGKLKAHTAPPTDMALMQLFQFAERTMDRVSNIDKARMGLPSNETSGIAIRQRAIQSALVQVKAFDNFRHFQLLIGKFTNANLGLMFPVQKTLRLRLPSTGVSQLVTLNQEQIVAGAKRVVNSTRGEQFDVAMDLTPANTTFREFQAQNIANLLGQIGPTMQGNPLLLPPFLSLFMGLIQMLENLPNREQILQQVRDAISKLGQPPAGPKEPEPPRVNISLKGDLSPQDARVLADGRLDQAPTSPPAAGPGAPLLPGMPGPPGSPPPGVRTGPPAVAPSSREPFVPAAATPSPPGPPQAVTAPQLAEPGMAERLAAMAAMARLRGGA